MEQLAVWAGRLEGFVRVGTLWSERDAEEWYRKFGCFAFGSTIRRRAELRLSGTKMALIYKLGGKL
ncbi:MAG: hypothetical protein IKF78_15870 [Atopobiaceae bacterium]|nr:hypothetical protein [Atopobiaceae bacterium]